MLSTQPAFSGIPIDAFPRRPDFIERAQCGPPAGTQLGSQALAIGWSAIESLQQYPCRANAATQRSSRQAFVSGEQHVVALQGSSSVSAVLQTVVTTRCHKVYE